MLPAFIQINSGIFSKNGFSYEYHYDFNQLAALYLKMLALKAGCLCVPKMTALFACG